MSDEIDKVLAPPKETLSPSPTFHPTPTPIPYTSKPTKSSQPTERTTTTPPSSGKTTGKPTLRLTHTTKIAPSLNPIPGRVLNNAPNPGNAEVPDSAREEDGAPDMTAVREPHSQIKLQDSPLTSERFTVPH